MASSTRAEISVHRIEEDTRIAVVHGDFEYGQDLDPLFDELLAFRPDMVTFESPGGYPMAAMELGRFLRRNEFNTIQLRSLECASACSLAFLGGVHRIAEPGSIGVHQSAFAEGAAVEFQVEAVQAVTAELLSYLREMGVDSGFLETALQYTKDDMRYLSSSEMARFRVTTDSAGPAQEQASSPGSSASSPASRPRTVPVTASPPEAVELEDVEDEVPSSSFSRGAVLHPDGLVDVRDAPSFDNPPIGMMGNGAEVDIIEIAGSWYRIANGRTSGYVPAGSIKVDGFYDAGAGRRYIQILSLGSIEEVQDYLAATELDVDVYHSVTDWYAVTLKGHYSEEEAEVVLERVKYLEMVPQDAFSTYGNTYRDRICCDR